MQSKSTNSKSPEQRKDDRRHKIDSIASAAILAAVIHAACFFLALWLYFNNIGNPTAAYELYRPAFVVDSNLTSTIETKLAQRCPYAKLSPFTMQGDFVLPNTTTQLTAKGTLLSTRTTMFGFVHLNGYYLLFFIFGVSFVAQVNVVWEYNRMKKNDDDSFFVEPCAARWFEYALTSPCMITIIAASLLIRDIHTILLLAAAQGALCQFGFGMECAYTLRVCEDPKETELESDIIKFRPLPVLPILRTIPKMSQQLWYWSFTPSMLLHVLVWGILIVSLLDQINTKCFADQPSPPTFIIAILIAQGILFTLFVVVAVVQAWKLDMIPFKKRLSVQEDDVWDSFVDAFYSYTLLSAIAKAVLGITYVSYVNMFPFYTPPWPSPQSVVSAGMAPIIQALS